MDCCVCGCKRCTSLDSKSLKKELWRIRINWLFLFVLGGLYAVSYTSISSSFHQFVTNPSAKELNGSNATMEYGLGQSESFYSWLISLFNIGAFLGAVICGFLVKCVPYWHLILFSLFTHTVGYILYAVTYQGWLIMFSKALSGFFIGAELTLALSYIALSSLEYDKLRGELGMKNESNSNLRTTLFALHNIGINIGYIFGPGFAVIFAQFDFDQFRSIAWYNVALGIACMILQFFLFHGESNCKKVSKECNLCISTCGWKDFKIKPSEAFILLFFIVLRGILSFRFGAYETVYNPVLGDYFGFNERDSSYFFFGLTLAQIAGTLLLIGLQRLKLSSQMIAIIGLSITLVSFALMADWQAIPYDKCTEYSPFHHPEIIENYTASPNIDRTNIRSKRSSCYKDLKTGSIADMVNELDIIPASHLVLSSGQTVDIPLVRTIRFSCQVSEQCNVCDTSLHNVNRILCLQYSIDKDGCLIPQNSVRDGGNLSQSFFCAAEISAFSVCIQILEDDQSVQTQSLQHLKQNVYKIAMRNCLEANTTHDDCYWNPYSIITNKHCEDCQPICRSRKQSLSFIQFVLGSALLLVSIPIAWVPVAALVSSRVSKGAQGIVMGCMVALTAIGRSISPLWLDAAYEGMGKRTFLAMVILAATHLPFLLGIIILYKSLNQAPTNGYSKIQNSDSEDSVSDNEQ